MEATKLQQADPATDVPLRAYGGSLIAQKLSFVSRREWANLPNYLANSLISAALNSAHCLSCPDKSRSIGQCLDDLDDFGLLEDAIGLDKADRFRELELSQEELFALVQFLLFENLQAPKCIGFPKQLVTIEEARSSIKDLGFDCELSGEDLTISDGLAECTGNHEALLAIAQHSKTKVLPDLDTCIEDSESLEVFASNLLYEINDLELAVKSSLILTNVERFLYRKAIEQAINTFEALQEIGETRQFITVNEVDV